MAASLCRPRAPTGRWEAGESLLTRANYSDMCNGEQTLLQKKKKKKAGSLTGLSSDLILKCARTNTHAQNVFNDELICAVSQRKDISNSIFQLALKAHAYNLSYPQKDYKSEVCLDHIANSRPVWAHTFNPSA